QLDGAVLPDGRHGNIDDEVIVLLWIVEIFTSAQIMGRSCDAERHPNACRTSIRATKRLTSSSLVENDGASNSRPVGSAFCNASASLPDRTRPAPQSFHK